MSKCATTINDRLACPRCTEHGPVLEQCCEACGGEIPSSPEAACAACRGTGLIRWCIDCGADLSGPVKGEQRT